VVIHRTPTEGLDLETHHDQMIDKITEENKRTEKGYRIEEVQ
jgi:hypothetical protein